MKCMSSHTCEGTANITKKRNNNNNNNERKKIKKREDKQYECLSV